MGLETATYISDLVETNPAGTDQALQGDNHLRLIKSVLKNTFPGANKPIYGSSTSEIKTVDYTIALTDDRSLIQIDATSDDIEVNLDEPSGVPDGFEVSFVKVDNTPNPVFIFSAGGDAIDIWNSYEILVQQGQTVTLRWSGVSEYWIVLARNNLETTGIFPTVVRVSTNTWFDENITISTTNAGANINSYVLAADDIIALCGQNVLAENGIYKVRSSGGLLRHPRFSNYNTLCGSKAYVMQGDFRGQTLAFFLDAGSVVGTNDVYCTIDLNADTFEIFDAVDLGTEDVAFLVINSDGNLCLGYE